MPEPLIRGFMGEQDLGAMQEVSDVSRLADGMNMVYDTDAFRNMFAPLMDKLPSRNAVAAEAGGKIVGHALIWWRDVAEGQRLYSHQSAALPEYEGLRARLMDWAEARLLEISEGHPEIGEKFLETQTVPGTELDSLVKARGYEPARFFFEMLRPLNDLQEVKLPEGITLTVVTEGGLKEAWAVSRDAFKDQWGYSPKNWSDERLEDIVGSSLFDLSLWFVALADGEVVGSVRNYIKSQENDMLNRKRGYISSICVSRPWRRRGIAAALLSKSMRELAARGMAEARLGVDSDSPTGALSLYMNSGFAVSNTYVSCRKPLCGMPDSLYGKSHQ